MGDPWHWRAVYSDESTLDEYDDDRPNGRGWAEAERYGEARNVRLVTVILIPQRDHLMTHTATIHMESSIPALRVFRRRTAIVSLATGEQIGEGEPITAIELLYGDGHAAYTFLFTDGSVVMSDDLNAV